MVTVTGHMQQCPPENYQGERDLPVREVEATGGDYFDAVRQVEAEVPDGWRLLCIDLHRTDPATTAEGPVARTHGPHDSSGEVEPAAREG